MRKDVQFILKDNWTFKVQAFDVDGQPLDLTKSGTQILWALANRSTKTHLLTASLGSGISLITETPGLYQIVIDEDLQALANPELKAGRLYRYQTKVIQPPIINFTTLWGDCELLDSLF